MREIPLIGKKGFGLVALVDGEDFERLNAYRWVVLRNEKSYTAYARTIVDGQTILMHHMVLPPQGDGLHTDHIDRNGLNNQRLNLRRVTPSVNMSNRAPFRNTTNIHAVTSRGRVYYYHRQTRIRLPDDPGSPEFAAALRRLNGEQRPC